MNIIVCVKPVPDPEKYDLLKIDEKTKRLVREGIPTIINPSDRNALEEALALKEKFGGKVIIVSMAPLFSADRIKLCLAMGADEAYVISDKAFGGADTYSTSYTLMKGIERAGIKPDLILAGNESADGATSHVPTQLAEWMDLPHLTNVTIEDSSEEEISVRKKVENGHIDYKVKYPAVLAVSKSSNKPRYISAMGIRDMEDKMLTVYGKEDLDIVDSMIGLIGSPTQPGQLIVPEMKRDSEELSGDKYEVADQIIALIKKQGVSV